MSKENLNQTDMEDQLNHTEFNCYCINGQSVIILADVGVIIGSLTFNDSV